MEPEYSILIYQRAGTVVDWYTQAHYGPFDSQEEREEWMNHRDNAVDGKSEKYVVAYLKK